MVITSFSYENEEYAFPREMFWFKVNGHKLKIAHNKLYVDDEERLRVHLTLYCSNCREEHTVRTRFPYGYENENEAAAFCKLMVIAHFC